MNHRLVLAPGLGKLRACCNQVSPHLANGKPWLIRAFVASFLALMATRCHPAPPVPQAEQTPEQAFILEHFTFEERRNGQLLWRGQAARGAGDINTSDVTGVQLTRVPQEPGQMPLHIRADIAHLALADGLAHFRPVYAFDDCGRTLQGGPADYDEAKATLRADGPIRITTPQGHLDATSATVALDTGTIVLEGPVIGRFAPPDRSAPRP